MSSELRLLRAALRQAIKLADDLFAELPDYVDGRFDRLEDRLGAAKRKAALALKPVRPR